MQTQLSKLKVFMAEGDHKAALRLASKWSRLGDHKERITQGWAALSNPDFYRQIGKDPEALVASGISAIRERYEI